MDMPVFCTPVSIAIAIISFVGLFSNLAMEKPNANPNQGSPMPQTKTCHVIILKM